MISRWSCLSYLLDTFGQSISIQRGRLLFLECLLSLCASSRSACDPVGTSKPPSVALLCAGGGDGAPSLQRLHGGALLPPHSRRPYAAFQHFCAAAEPRAAWFPSILARGAELHVDGTQRAHEEGK